MTGENKRKNITAQLASSSGAWDAALRNAAAGDLKTAVNRLYYAAYHAVVAVCLSEGLEAKTHRGVSHLLKLHFVVPNHLPDWVESAFSKLQTDRDLADYEPEFQLSSERYAERQADAEKMIHEFRAFLRARGLVDS